MESDLDSTERVNMVTFAAVDQKCESKTNPFLKKKVQQHTLSLCQTLTESPRPLTFVRT